MPSQRKSRVAKKLARPAADASCTKTRTVTRGTVPLDVWSCSSPRFGEPLEEPRQIGVAPVVKKIGRRLQRFFYVSRADAEHEDADYTESGWWFEAVNPDPLWVSDDAIGPYATIDEAIDDARLGAAAGGC
jgi:hypothetical protein